MKRYDQMDDYEQAIVKALTNLGYSEEEAINSVEAYYDCMDRVGWYWSPGEWAERLHHVIQQGISPRQWLLNMSWKLNLKTIEKIDNILLDVKNGEALFIYQSTDGKESVDISLELVELVDLFKRDVLPDLLRVDTILKESLKESIEEMELMKEGKLPKKSWREMMKEIREDKENGRL